MKFNLREKVVLKPCSLEKENFFQYPLVIDVTQNYTAVLGLMEVVYTTVYLTVSGEEILSLHTTTTSNYPEPDEHHLTLLKSMLLLSSHLYQGL